jgi:putative ABC transport system permease protein
VRAVLVVTEFALALVLLVGAGLLIRSFVRLQEMDAGFDPTHLLTFQVSLPEAKYKDDTRIRSFYDRLLPQLAAAPGVKSVSASSSLPLEGGWTQSFEIEGLPMSPGPHAFMQVISPEYLPTMRIPLLRGRAFAAGDNQDAPGVALIDATLAQSYFGNVDPVGKRINMSLNSKKPDWRQIVGIVRDVKRTSGLQAEHKGLAYFPIAQMPQHSLMIEMRTDRDPLAMVSAARATVLRMDPQQPIYEVRSMEQVMAEFASQPRFNMLLLGIFAALALVLASWASTAWCRTR